MREFLDTRRIVAALGGRDLKSTLAATFLGTPFVAFVAAIRVDQPFRPVLVVALLAMTRALGRA